MGQVGELKGTILRVPLLAHIRNRVKQLEKATGGIVALQFSDHAEGLGMVVRIFIPASEKEYTYPDCIIPMEYANREIENSRVDVLFDCIHEALERVQPVSSMSGGLIHHS